MSAYFSRFCASNAQCLMCHWRTLKMNVGTLWFCGAAHTHIHTLADNCTHAHLKTLQSLSHARNNCVQLFTGALARNGEKKNPHEHAPYEYGVPAFWRLFSAHGNCPAVETSKFLFCRQRELEGEGESINPPTPSYYKYLELECVYNHAKYAYLLWRAYA